MSETDNVELIKKYDPAIQKAWSLLSMHNTELMTRIRELERQLEERSVIGLIKYKISNALRSNKYDY